MGQICSSGRVNSLGANTLLGETTGFQTNHCRRFAINLKFPHGSEELKGIETYGEYEPMVVLIQCQHHSLHGNGWIILIYYWVSFNFVIVCGCC